MSATMFQTYSPLYQNISNRIDRLKHNKTSQVRYNSLNRDASRDNSMSQNITLRDNMGLAQSYYRPNGRKGSPIVTLQDELPQKVPGRVTKNTGLKKYNQRQLKEVGQCRAQINTTETKSSAVFRVPTHGWVGKLVPGKIYTRQTLEAVI